MQLSEQLIYCTTKIINIIDETKIATGTGFFMNFNENLEKGTCQPVIITNKHVVKDAKKIIFSVCRADENNNPLDQQKFTIILDEFKIINHPDNDVDLCAIPIASLDSYSQEYKVRLYRGKLGTDLIINEDEVKDCSAMEDIIMIGYPNGLEDSYNNKPIIRKGITSTHLKFDYNGKKEFLIDMACFPGSSGSPIFFCNESSYTQGNTTFFGSRCKLLGLLYGGPQHTSTGSVVFENIPTNPKASSPSKTPSTTPSKTPSTTPSKTPIPTPTVTPPTTPPTTPPGKEYIYEYKKIVNGTCSDWSDDWSKWSITPKYSTDTQKVQKRTEVTGYKTTTEKRLVGTRTKTVLDTTKPIYKDERYYVGTVKKDYCKEYGYVLANTGEYRNEYSSWSS